MVSWLGLLIAALPSVGLGLYLKGKGSRSSVPANETGGERNIPYVSVGLLGGLMGEITAVCSLSVGTWWSCFKGDQLCHNGQAGMVLIPTIPLLSFFCSIFRPIVDLGKPSDSGEQPLTSIFRYSGSRRLLNWTCATLFQ